MGTRCSGCLLLALAAGLWGGCAAPQPRPEFPPAPSFPPDHRYTLDELIELSVHRNPGLRAARYETGVAEGFVDQVKALWLPALRYDFAALGYSNDLNYKAKALNLVSVNVPLTGAYNIENSINYGQILATFGKRTSGLKQARMAAEIVRLQVLAQQDLVACEVANLYYLVCLSNDIDRILDDTLRRVGVYSEVVQRLNELGSMRASKVNYLQADLVINELQQLRVAVQAGRQTAYAALKRAVGLDRDEPLILRDLSLPPPMTYQEAISVSAAIGKGFLARPTTRQMDLIAQISREQVHFVKTLWAPNVVTVNTFADSQGHHHNIVNAVDGLIASLILDQPIYTPANRARLRTALYAERATEALQELVEQILVLEIEATALETQRALKTVLKANRAREIAAEHEQATRRAYTREVIPATDVVIAVTLNAFSRIQYLSSVFAYHSARARLNRVTANREARYGW